MGRLKLSMTPNLDICRTAFLGSPPEPKTTRRSTHRQQVTNYALKAESFKLRRPEVI
jgi:hypothetical protein